MEFKTVALIGAGAIGCYFVLGMAENLGENFCLVAEGERRERLLKNGIVINGKTFRPAVKTPEEAKGTDLIIIGVKYPAMGEVLSYLDRTVDEHTTVLCPMNGVDTEEMIAARIGEEHVVYSFMKISSAREGNSIRFDPATTLGIMFGEKDNERTDRVLSLEKLFLENGVHCHICEDIMQDMWYKMASNISRNLPQAIVGCGFGAFEDSEHMAYLCARMREEVTAVAAAKGVDISDVTDVRASTIGLPREARFSTLQDLDAKRPTEIEMFSGTLIRMGKELGVPTPFNEFAYHTIRALEEKNAGKFC